MSERRLTEMLRSPSHMGGAGDESCPDEQALAGYLDGVLPGSEREALERHLAGCDVCLAAVGFLSRAAEMPARRSAPPALVDRAREATSRAQRASLSRPAWRWAAMAAGLVLVTSVVLWNLPDANGSDPELTSPADGTRLVDPDALGPTILAPAEGSTISGDVVRIRWSGPRPSRFYDVRVVDGDGTVLWQGRTESTEIVVPSDVGLVPGEEYFVRVSAHLVSDKTLRSPHVGFRVGGETPF